MFQELLSIYASAKVIKEISDGKKEIEKGKQNVINSINSLLEIEVNIDFLKEFHNMLKCEARRFIKCLVLAWKLKQGKEVDLTKDYSCYELEVWDELRSEYEKAPYDISRDIVDAFFSEMPSGYTLGHIISEYAFSEISFIKFLFGLWVMGNFVGK